MHAVHLVRFKTPKGVWLYGYWVGVTRPKRVIIWTHGLGSSMFSKFKIARLLAKSGTAVLMYNNRGHDKVASISIGKKYVRAGAAHEVFIDCVDDIQGAVNFARRQGKPAVYLAGHSTGCQKSVYWAYKKGRGVKGIILLGPVSDHAATHFEYGAKKVRRALAYAQGQVKRGKGKELLPSAVWGWPWLADAQRFVSLYAGKGAEEVFTYWDPKKKPVTLAAVRIPILVLLAGREEFVKEPAKQIAAWFSRHIRKGEVIVVPRVGHSYRGGEMRVAREIQRFIAR